MYFQLKNLMEYACVLQSITSYICNHKLYEITTNQLKSLQAKKAKIWIFLFMNS